MVIVHNLLFDSEKVLGMGVARGKTGWGSFPKGRRPRAGCGAEFWVLDGGGIPRI